MPYMHKYLGSVCRISFNNITGGVNLGILLCESTKLVKQKQIIKRIY